MITFTMKLESKFINEFNFFVLKILFYCLRKKDVTVKKNKINQIQKSIKNTILSKNFI